MTPGVEAQSEPLDHQGSPYIHILELFFSFCEMDHWIFDRIALSQ